MRRRILIGSGIVGALLAWYLLKEDPAPVPSPAPAPVRGGATVAPPTPPAAPAPPASAPIPAEDPAPAPGPGRTRILVLDAEGNPAKGAEVVLLRGADTEALRVRTGIGIPPGTEGVADLMVDGWLRVLVHFPGHAPFAGDRFEAPVEGTKSVEIRLDRGLAVAGVVLEQDGRTPVPGVKVEAAPVLPLPVAPHLSPDFSTRTGPDGRFRIPGLPDGRVRVRAEGAGVGGGAIGLDAEAGDEDLRLVLAPRTRIDFLLVDASTGGPPRALFWEIREGTGGTGAEELRAQGSRPPDSAGKDAAGPLDAGFLVSRPGVRHRFRASAAGYRDRILEVEAAPGQGILAALFELEPDPTGGTTLTLRFRTEGEPLPDQVMVTRVADQGGWSGWSASPSSGSLVLSLLPGRSRLFLGGGMGTAVTPGQAPWIAEPVTLDLAPGEKVTRDVTLRRGGWIRLRGADRPSGERLLLRAGEEEFHARFEQIEADGIYVLRSEAVPAGTWTLVVPGKGEAPPAEAAVTVRAGEVVEVRIGRKDVAE